MHCAPKCQAQQQGLGDPAPSLSTGWGRHPRHPPGEPGDCGGLTATPLRCLDEEVLLDHEPARQAHGCGPYTRH